MLSKLSEIYGESLAQNILEHPQYDKRLLCKIIPYLNGKEDLDANTEAKLRILSDNVQFFFLFASSIDHVPYLRLINEETRKTLSVDVWSPWIELEKELEIFYNAQNRKEEMDWIIYDILDFEEGAPSFDDILKDSAYKEAFTRFFYTYPVLSRLLLDHKRNIPLAVYFDYPYISNKMAWFYVRYARSEATINKMLENANPSAFSSYAARHGLFSNIFVIKWLHRYCEIEKLPYQSEIKRTILSNDDIEMFQTLYNSKVTDSDVNTLIRSKSERILLYLMDSEERVKIYNKFISLYSRGRMNKEMYEHYHLFLSLFSKMFGVLRYYDAIDTFKIAIIMGNWDWIRTLPKDSLFEPIYDRHPLSYLFDQMFTNEKLHEIVPYLSTIYKESLHDIIRMNPTTIFMCYNRVEDKIRAYQKFLKERKIFDLLFLEDD